MTAQKLYGTLKFLDALDSKFGLQTSLEAIREALTSLVGAPAQPTHQSALATAMAAFDAAAAKLSDSITPSQAAAIADMGGAEFFDPAIAEKVKLSIQSNAMTPSVARDFVQDLASRRATFLGVVRSAIQGLEKLNVRESALVPGTADLAFLIPRELFDHHLDEFAKELKFIDRLIRDLSEALTGQPQAVDLQELSSSIPTIAVGAGLIVIDRLATIVNKFLDAWKKLEEIRDIRARLKKVGRTGTHIEDELNEEITTIVEEVVEESTSIVLVDFKGEAVRRNELETAIKQDTKRLFGQIERGLTIEFRAVPNPNADEEDKKALGNVSALSRDMLFPEVTNEPLLLASGEVLEGEIRGMKATKKITKTSTTKKETQKITKSDRKEDE
jgi:hypothetical protein